MNAVIRNHERKDTSLATVEVLSNERAEVGGASTDSRTHNSVITGK